jgi:hypothetical protein
MQKVKYKPLPSQRLFHSSKARFKGFSGPIGSGKSAALCHEALRALHVNQGRTGLIGAPTYPMLRDATLPLLMEVLEENDFKFEHNKAESVLVFKDAESKILLRSLDEFERLRGTNLAWFGVDELTYTSEEAWTRLEGRLRDPKAKHRSGFAVWTPRGQDWVYRRFIQSPVKGYECVQAKPFENTYLLDVIPDYYDRLKESYDATFYEQEVLGQYVGSKEGLVYRRFDRSRNVEKLEFDPKQPLYWALDFNVDPMSSLVVQVQGKHVYVLDEIVLRRAGTRDACEEFLRRYPAFPAGLRICADASAYHEHTSGWSDREVLESMFAERGIGRVRYQIPKANPAVRHRVELVNGRLAPVNGEVNLLVDPRCKELIADFEAVTWVAGTHEIDKAKDAKRTHLSDALGYLVWQEFHQSMPTVGFRSKRIIG